MRNESINYVNFYSYFTNISKIELRKILENEGWSFRKESCEDFELNNQWSELNLIASNSEPILKGIIQNPKFHYEFINTIFRNNNIKFLVEIYNEKGERIYEDDNR